MSDIQSVAPEGPARRETPIDVVNARAARVLVAPVSQKIAAWHAESIKLETMALRARQHGRADAALSEATRTLLDFVKHQEAAFEKNVGAAPDLIRAHNRIADTRMVLGRLRERLEATLVQIEGRQSAKATRLMQGRHSS